uniref:CRAL-TRIO domain-containing protein n=1 Tax=Ascaris lumbricoides TaxID=6252 RepID=A0A0M3ID39_ASCLU
MKAQLNEEEEKQVAQLRKLVEHNLTDYYDTDFNLLRWLQGHPGSVESVAEKLNEHLRARSSSWKLDDLWRQPVTHNINVHNEILIEDLSYVRDNIVVVVDQCGSADHRGMLQTHSFDEVLLATCYEQEHILHRVMEVEHLTGRQAWVVYVMDLNGLEYSKYLYELTLGPTRCMVDFLCAHYVEIVKCFVLVNVPPFVNALWTLIRPFLPNRTKQKIQMLSSSNWREEILKYASADALPTTWNISTEQRFKADLARPFPFEEENFHCNRKEEVPTDCKTVYINAHKNIMLDFELCVGNELSWWITANMDLAFGVFCSDRKDETNTKKMKVVYPNLVRLPGPLVVPLKGSITAENNAYYKIYFANTRTSWRPLAVTYSIIVKK